MQRDLRAVALRRLGANIVAAEVVVLTATPLNRCSGETMKFEPSLSM
jgi:hypothetical protein